MPDIVALDRLKSQLRTSGLAERNTALFQVIDQLIDFLRQSINLTASQIAAVTPTPSPVTTINSGYAFIVDNDGGDSDGVGNPIIPVGPVGPRGVIGPMGPPGLDGDSSEFEGDYMPFIGNSII